MNGHFKSSFKNKSISRTGEPLPWYTYPMIDFLRTRLFVDKTILEFGGGQSTLWWATQAKRIISFEDDKDWFEILTKKIPTNVELFYITKDSREKSLKEVSAILDQLAIPAFDIVIIDGLSREDMINVACSVVSPNGAILCDNAEGYGFYESFKEREFKRIDFFGHAPGVIFPHCTSIYFRMNNFLFDPHLLIPTRK
ncbi:MAG: hypothetical protein ABJB16_08220 [Saprospiraceae bacterium]